MATAWPGGAGAAGCELSNFIKVVPAEPFEASADVNYRKVLAAAKESRALAPDEHPQLKRLRYMMARILPFAVVCNARAADWTWEINLVGSRKSDGVALPGGKLVVYYGALSEWQLSDDELAHLVAHLMAHAALEHARKNVAMGALSAAATQHAASVMGLDSTLAAATGSALQTMRQTADDEVEAHQVALMLAAQAGYRPEAARTVWDRLREHPGQHAPLLPMASSRSAQAASAVDAGIEAARPVYEVAPKPDQLFGAPRRLGPAASAPP